MNNITVKLIDHTSDIPMYTQLACTTTRAANKYLTADELINGISKRWPMEKVKDILRLPHSKIKRFVRFTFIVSGASRRFLAQLSTHQVGIDLDYMSGSLQYSDHSKQSLQDKFVVPYALLDSDLRTPYLQHESDTYLMYCNLINNGIDNDSAGYVMPESLRNVIMINVNLEELCYIGKQRLCKRNTPEITYVVAKMIKLVCDTCGLDFSMFLPNCCNEGVYSCGEPISELTADEFLKINFPLLTEVI